MASGLANRIVGTQDATFANSAAANTAVNVDVAASNDPWTQHRDHLLVVYNPSSVTALTVRVIAVETLGGGEREALIETLAVPADSARAFLVSSLGFGEISRVQLRNDTALGLTDGFTAVVRIRRGTE